MRASKLMADTLRQGMKVSSLYLSSREILRPIQFPNEANIMKSRLLKENKIGLKSRVV